MGTTRLLCLLTAALLSVATRAQIDFYPQTLEYLTDSSDLVVRATIKGVKTVDHSPDVVDPRPNIRWFVVDLDVLETLKGEQPKTLTLIVEGSKSDDPFAPAMRDPHPILWFLTKRPNREQDRPADFPIADSPFKIEDLDNRTYDLTFQQRSRRLIGLNLYPNYIESNILKEVRKEAALKPGRNDRSLTVAAPAWYGVSATKGKPSTITFPLDERLEPLAKKWVLPRNPPWTRLIGVKVLSAFKSEANIAILELLVNDPGGIGIDSFGGKADYKTEAAETLLRWGVPLPPPPLIEKLDPKSISAKPIRVQVDGVEVSFKDVSPPRIIGGRAYARACTLSDRLGVKMGTYLLKDSTGVSLDKRGLTIYMPIDSHSIWINDTPATTPYPARLIKQEGFFPIRFIAEKIGATVEWDPQRRMVLIRTKEGRKAQ